MARRYYDPDPRRRSRRGHRRGVEPAGLKRWRLAHRRRTHDPGRKSSLWRGRRGGYYFQGPHKRRYDPAPPRRRFRSAGGKAEGFFNKWGTALGALIGLGAGAYTGYNEYNDAYGPNAGQNYINTIIGGEIKDKTGAVIKSRPPEISHLWANDEGWTPLNYLQYKFLGIDSTGKYIGSAWVYPFWFGFASTIARPIAKLFTNKADRILKPLQKIGIGMLAVSTIGALALPGSPKRGDLTMSNRPNNAGATPATPAGSTQYTYGKNST